MFSDLLGPGLKMSLLLQLEKGNLPRWCLIMVSSKLRALFLNFLIFVSFCFKLLFRWFIHVHLFFRNVISMDEYASYFDNIDPLAPYKKLMFRQDGHKELRSREDVLSQRVQAAFIVSDPVDWSRDIQVSPASHIFIFRCDTYLIKSFKHTWHIVINKAKWTFVFLYHWLHDYVEKKTKENTF